VMKHQVRRRARRSALLRRFGYEATVRPSLAVYNDKSDIDALVATLHDLQSRWLR
jgi:cysteine desulfurase/selenocysteine lyase